MRQPFATRKTLQEVVNNFDVSTGVNAMFKLIVMIDCDTCGDPFRCVALSTDRGPNAWQHLTGTLEGDAQSHGWDLYREARCYDCIEEIVSSQSEVIVDEDTPF